MSDLLQIVTGTQHMELSIHIKEKLLRKRRKQLLQNNLKKLLVKEDCQRISLKCFKD